MQHILAAQGPGSFHEIVDYVEAVLRDNWVPGPDNTRMEPYSSSARAIILSILNRLAHNNEEDQAVPHNETTSAINIHLRGIQATVGSDEGRREMYRSAIASYMSAGWTDFSMVRVGDDMELLGVMERMDLLTVEHLDRAIRDLEVQIDNWQPSVGQGAISIAELAKNHVGLIKRRRRLVVKEETSGDEDN
jgi:hypothetical protein